MSDYTNPQFWPQLIQLAQTIDTLDYFQILNLPQTANRGQVQASYYAMARSLHPDKFYHIQDPQVTASVQKIYKRITESYSILRDDAKRKKYLADINGPNRAQRLRFNEESEKEQAEAERAKREVATTPQGKKLYNAARLDMEAGNWDSAFRNIQSALMFEMGNERLQALKDEINAKRGK